MGVLNDLKSKIDKHIEEKKLDGSVVRGKIGLQTGFLLTLVNASTPDDPTKIEKLRKAAEAVLQVKF
jgi:hypothetical protein